MAYSLPERWARRLLRGPGQPEYYYSLSEFRRGLTSELQPKQHLQALDGAGERAAPYL